jgi:hypothetical protein
MSSPKTTMTMPREQLLALFEDLQWRGVKEQFTDLVARAIKSRWHPEPGPSPHMKTPGRPWEYNVFWINRNSCAMAA